MAETETMNDEQEMRRLFRLFGDLPADKAHSEMKKDPTVRNLPKRQEVRDCWKENKAQSADQGKVWICSDGRRFLTRQGRYRYCKRNPDVTPIRGDA